MSDRREDPELAQALRELASDAAPAVLAAALEAARADAQEILRRRLVAALLEAAVPRRARPPSGDRLPADAAAHGVYVYGITRRPAGDVTGTTGIDASAVYAIAADGLTAVVSDVSGEAEAWGTGPDGEPDLTALAPRLEAHERVLEGLLDLGGVLPMRFGRLYRSRADVTGLLGAHSGAIDAALARVEGRVEWGLTVTWDRRLAAERDRPAAGPHQESQTAGRAYLVRREAERTAAELLADRGAEASARVHLAASRAARESIAHPVRRGPEEEGAETILRASYLVATMDRERFEAVIVECLHDGAGLGLRGELTGPWPPYNFSQLDLDEVTA